MRNHAYIIVLLIPTFCVLAGYLVCRFKVKLNCDRAETCGTESCREEYYKKAKRDKRVGKWFGVAAFVCTIISITLNVIFWVSTKKEENAINDSNISEANESFDPKEIHKQAEEQSVENLFHDYLFFDWYKETEGNRKQGYKDKIDDLIEGKESVTDASENLLEGEEKKAYLKCKEEIAAIDELKVPEGHTLEELRNGEIDPLPLDVDTHKEEHDLWASCYLLCPTAANLQQKARSAMDVQNRMMQYQEYSNSWEEIIEYAYIGIWGYIDLLLFQAAGESKPDCCYWIGKAFYELAQSMPDEYEEYREHCYWMAYAFAEKGMEYMNESEGENEHLTDLQEMQNHVGEILHIYK